MGRTRLIYFRRTNNLRQSPRFEVGQRVRCKYGGQWCSGHVVAHNYEEPSRLGVFHPYQIQLQDDQKLIYAWADNDAMVQKVSRFDIGERVWCKCGGQWASGRVIDHNCEEPTGVFHPYQIRLQNDQLIYAWADDDACIQKAARFEVGMRVHCKYGEQWASGRVIAHNYEEPEGVFHPYQIKLQDDRLIFATSDDDTCIQMAARFDVGTRVECYVANGRTTGQWCRGRVMALKHEEILGVLYPYQVKLYDGRVIYVPTDDDTCIKVAGVGNRMFSPGHPYPKLPRRLAPG